MSRQQLRSELLDASKIRIIDRSGKRIGQRSDLSLSDFFALLIGEIDPSKKFGTGKKRNQKGS